jgi:hypothetical protein
MVGDSRLAGPIAWIRSIFSGLVGLFFLIALSILVVWPLWYLAINHTSVYSSAMLLLATGSVVLAIKARIRKHLRRVGRRRMKSSDSEKSQLEPTEHGE